ncbi:transglutaminaseTgpA domain-containing protein [Coraliomargarita parva]|uniref:transglutaminase family protein n=1 Tax=Coraliomargarita parva TaxID=3014050 RepID=UPI0022B339D3|nr:transglutaminaseTgpA domain-containing protein [Coraliomargarita parva]
MRESVRLTIEELLEFKWLLGGMLCLLSLWSLLSLNDGNGLFVGLGMLGCLLLVLRPSLLHRFAFVSSKWIAPVLFVMIAMDFFLHLPEFLPPLVRMVVLLVFYRMVAPRKKREDLQLVLLCLFCLVIAGVLSVSMLFALQILLFTPVAMAILFIICVLDRGERKGEGQPVWANFNWRRLLGRVYQVLELKVLFLGTVMFFFVVGVSSVLFVLTPRVNLDKAIPFLQISGQARSGFSEDVRLGDVGEIINDDSEALRVDVPSQDSIESMPYWRMIVLDQYNQGFFRMSMDLMTDDFLEPGESREVFGQSPVPFEARNEVWTFYLEGGVSKYLPLPGQYRLLRFPQAQEYARIKELNLIHTTQVKNKVLAYQVQGMAWSRRFPVSDAEARALGEPVEPYEAPFVSYPSSTRVLYLSPEERAILDRINQEALSTEGGDPEGGELDASGYSRLVNEYLWKHYRYALKPEEPRTDGDPIVAWLDQSSRGHCEYFAGSFVLLARAAGYPARMVVGFAGGSWNSVEEYFVVRNRNAHAWAEIYDAGSREWLRVDPTPGNGPSNPDLEMPGSLGYDVGLAAWMDSLRMQWYRRIVNFDQQDQIQIADSVLKVFKLAIANMKEWLRDRWTGLLAWLQSPSWVDGIRLNSVLLLVLVFGYLSWRLRLLAMRGVLRLRRRSDRFDPVRRQAGKYLVRVRRKLDQGARLDVAHGLEQVCHELEGLRFGPPVPVRAAQEIFKRTRQVLRGRHLA